MVFFCRAYSSPRPSTFTPLAIKPLGHEPLARNHELLVGWGNPAAKQPLAMIQSRRALSLFTSSASNLSHSTPPLAHLLWSHQLPAVKPFEVPRHCRLPVRNTATFVKAEMDFVTVRGSIGLLASCYQIQSCSQVPQREEEKVSIIDYILDSKFISFNLPVFASSQSVINSSPPGHRCEHHRRMLPIFRPSSIRL